MRSARPSLYRSLAPGLAAALAIVLFWIAYDDGSHGVTERGTVAIAVWWSIVVVVAFRLVQVRQLPAAALGAGGLLAAFALWTLASTLWAPSAEDAFSEFNRTALYLGVFVLVVLVARRADLARWSDGIAVAIVAIGVVALISRLLPGVFPDRGLATFLPSAATRLSFPLGYWNGLAVFIALGVPPLLRIALIAPSAVRRGVALGAAPLLVATIYLTSSRGGVATVVVGVVVFLALTERRWNALAALAVIGAGGFAAIAVLASRSELVNGPLDTDLAKEQGRTAALLLILVCVGTGLAWALISRRTANLMFPRTAGFVAVAVAAVGLLVAIALADPGQRLADFKRLPEQVSTQPDFVRAHLLSGGGSGRWQFWTVAIESWKAHPVRGLGAGSYEHWWAEHASFSYFVRDAHSFYLEVLGELGVVGFALVVSLAAVGVVAGALRALRGSSGEPRTTTAAFAAVFTAFCVALALDWMWELTAVGVAGMVALALVTGPATAPIRRPREVRAGETRPRSVRLALATGGLLVAVAWGAIFAQAVPVLSERAITRSEMAARNGDLVGAAQEAMVAREIEPWAATPYLQLALVEERQGDLPAAVAHVDEAISRSPRDWRLWLVAARLETKLGRVSSAEIRLRRAMALNPRSPLFAGLLQENGNG